MADAYHAAVIDLAELARTGEAAGPIWTEQSADLNVNLLVLAGDAGIAGHVHAEVDVLLVGVAGTGVVEVDGTECSVVPGQVLIIPKGAQRAIRSGGDRFAYLTCHRRRSGLWPRGVPRPGERPRASQREG
jgi:mannose-6-phosphate isomerase-like protein (cupin superfamily)